jgi:hypothetical protein
VEVLQIAITPNVNLRVSKPLSIFARISTIMNKAHRSVLVTAIILVFTFASFGQKRVATTSIDERNVRAEMNFLAGDAMQGRGSGSQFERIAAEYIGSQFMQFGLEPAVENGWDGKPTYIQTVSVPGRESLKDIKINGDPGSSISYGKDLVVLSIAAKEISGPLQLITAGETTTKGAIILMRLNADAKFDSIQPTLAKLRQDGAAAIILSETSEMREHWTEAANQRVGLSRRGGNLFIVSSQAFDSLAKLPAETQLVFNTQFAPGVNTATWNAIGKITGSDPTLGSQVILISSHLDHLGVRQNAPTDDKIYNGADDDASGSVAVMELARVLASGAKPKRTVYFVCFGSEEVGGFGANYFVNNLPFPKEKLVANLEFEMIGRPDSAVKPEELWLTGFERSNLGPELARRGAKLVQDPHPDQNFFQRSDNYTLARQGVIAHTVSSFGLHKDYHQASDEVRTIDFVHMTRSINSMVGPIQWLVNSDFVPAWVEGKRPS